jgi:hypothetical protein
MNGIHNKLKLVMTNFGEEKLDGHKMYFEVQSIQYKIEYLSKLQFLAFGEGEVECRTTSFCAFYPNFPTHNFYQRFRN